MLHRVKSSTPLDLQLPEIMKIKIPEGLNLLFYGFNSLRHALSILHTEGVSSLMKDRLEKLIAATDIDLTICPEKQSLTHLANLGAVYYYQEIKQRVKKTEVPDLITERQKRYAFLNFQHEGIDCSLQAKHLDLLIHSSTQAFYDLHRQEFVFKDQLCYQNFLLRRIYTPDLASLIEGATNDPIAFKTLLFILKNHLKMRYLGWTLSEHDRKIICFAAQNKIFIKRVNQSLQQMLKDYPYIEELKSELGAQSSNIDFILMEREVEKMDYIVYRNDKSIDTLIADIHWLEDQVTCTDSEKSKIIEDYCTDLLTDRNRNEEDKQKFVDRMPVEFIEKSESVKKWTLKKRAVSPVSRPIQFSGSASTTKARAIYMTKHFDMKHFKTPCEIPLIDEIILKLSNDAHARFEKEHNESAHRLFVFCAIVPFMSYEGTLLTKEYELDRASTALSIGALSIASVLVANLFSRVTYNAFYLGRAQHLLVIQALEDMMRYSKNHDDAPHTFSMIVLALKAALDTQYLLDGRESEDTFPVKGPRFFNIKTILRHIREKEAGNPGVISIKQVIHHLCIFCTRHELKLEEAFTARIQVSEELESQIDSLKSELEQNFDQIVGHIQAFKPMDKSLLCALAMHFSLSIQLHTLGHHENPLPLVTEFFKKTLEEEGTDPAKVHWLHTEPLSLFLQGKENRLALALSLNELSEPKKSSKENDQLPNISYT